MVSKPALHAIDRMLRDVTGIDTPFGGKVVVLGGDFRQTLPVVKRGREADIVDNCIVSSTLWPLFTRFSFSVNMRANGDPDFLAVSPRSWEW